MCWTRLTLTKGASCQTPPSPPPRTSPPAPSGNPKGGLPEKKPGKNRSGSDKRQREKITPVRWATAEFNIVASKARTAGLPFGAYMRALGLGDEGPRSQRIPPVEKELLISVRGLFGRLNSNVNQIAKNGNSGFPVDLPELRLVMKDYPRHPGPIFQALGKEPAPDAQDWDEFEAASRKALAANPGAETVAIPAALLHRMIGNAAAPDHPEPRRVMIAKGASRSGPRQLAVYLMRVERYETGEPVELLELQFPLGVSLDDGQRPPAYRVPAYRDLPGLAGPHRGNEAGERRPLPCRDQPRSPTTPPP